MPESADLPSIRKQAKAVGMLTALAYRYGRTYGELMWHAHRAAHDPGHFMTGGSELEGEDIPEWFWDAFTSATGVVPCKERLHPEFQGDDNFFSCSC